MAWSRQYLTFCIRNSCVRWRVAPGVGEQTQGCPFAPRRPQRVDRREHDAPPLEEVGSGWLVRCFEWRLTPSLGVDRSVPGISQRRASGRPVLEVDDLRAEHRSTRSVTIAADQVSFAIRRGTCAALVGESGSGKSTIARCVVGLHKPKAGSILLDGVVLAGRARDRPIEARRRIQLIFQNPYDSLNPHHCVADSISRPARVLLGRSSRDATRRAFILLEQVRLPRRIADRYPCELSGGERQRVAIARGWLQSPTWWCATKLRLHSMCRFKRLFSNCWRTSGLSLASLFSLSPTISVSSCALPMRSLFLTAGWCVNWGVLLPCSAVRHRNIRDDCFRQLRGD